MKNSYSSSVTHPVSRRASRHVSSLVAALMLLAFLLPQRLEAQLKRPDGFNDKYKLQELVILSRHNIRSPLSGNGSALASLTPNEWILWSSGPSELTQRGGALETIMGQFFGKWLVEQGLFPKNYTPTLEEVNVYANSMQRTIATAQYFTSGLMPTAGIRVNHRQLPSKMDPVFNPVFTKEMTPAYRDLVMKQIAAMGGKKGVVGINEELAPSYELIAEVLDLPESPAAKEKGMTAFNDYNTRFILEQGKEPGMKGSLKDANSAADAFILQYYEEPDTVLAAFGKTLTRDQWAQIAKIKDVYGDVLFTAPAVAANVAHPLLVYMNDELNAPGRKLTFLCGHDSNIASVNAALGVEPYELPQSIEKKTPIGSKLVIEKWVDADGNEFAALNLVYQTTDQLRGLTLLDLDNPPMVFPLKLSGLTPNADGLYPLADVNKRFYDAIHAYDAL